MDVKNLIHDSHPLLFPKLILNSYQINSIPIMKKIIHTETAPKAVGPYSQAVEKAGILFVSGQIPLNPETGEMIKGDIAEQTKMVLSFISGCLKAKQSNSEPTPCF